MILDEIVRYKRGELEARKQTVPLEKVRTAALKHPAPKDLASALRSDRLQIIAEVKKASPSRGVIVSEFDPLALARTYSENGAAAISILTETRYFQGSLEHLEQICSGLGASRPPLLRKDFIFEPYQVFETRARGGDALLLIVAILKHGELRELLAVSHGLKLSCLVEVHTEQEVELAVDSGASIIGINNRDLQTFKVDLKTTERLRPLVPADRIVVSESGIRDRHDTERLRRSGVDAVLVGESLLTAPNVADKMRELRG